jgi:DNA helicase II / ATP-dependent DNA helicase PcrA
MMRVAIDPVLGGLTAEQIAAAGTDLPRVFLEAAPGSGKTTVAAQRFGARRYNGSPIVSGTPDHRAVMAVSFTRSATRELKGRVRRTWGPTALRWPHRIVTLDALIYDLMRYLLAGQLIRWPGGHVELQVHDSWKVLVPHSWTRTVAGLGVTGQDVEFVTSDAPMGALRPRPVDFLEAIADGICTHDDVRRVLELSLPQTNVVSAIREHLRNTIRCLIVDEVFDANELDIQVLKLALEAGVEVAMIGDPWQALYGFRGARPDLVNTLLVAASVQTLPLSKSFRWQTDEQADLAAALRRGEGVELSAIAEHQLLRRGVDVVLAAVWADLWSAGSTVLPLAFGSAKGNAVEAATTLLLNQLTSVLMGVEATYLADALTTLRIADEGALRSLEPGLTSVLELVDNADKRAEWVAAYDALVDVVGELSLVNFPAAHANYLKRLKSLQTRLKSGKRVIPGMTIHQAKGREWDVVGCRLTSGEYAALASGLSNLNEKHRQLYVACTRARRQTLSMSVADGVTGAA